MTQQSDFEMIREVLKQACKFTPVKREDALEALSRIEAATLPELPEGWILNLFSPRRGEDLWRAHVTDKYDVDDATYDKTPYAATLAAISKIKEAGDE